jgi:hypothetical protein
MSCFLCSVDRISNISLLDVPSLQRTLFEANSRNPCRPQAPAIAYEPSMAQYRAMRTFFDTSTEPFPRCRCDKHEARTGDQT